MGSSCSTCCGKTDLNEVATTAKLDGEKDSHGNKLSKNTKAYSAGPTAYVRSYMNYIVLM